MLVADESAPATAGFMDALRRAGHGVRSVKRTSEATLALRSARVDALVVDPASGGEVADLRSQRPACPLVAWLPRASSERAAELLEQGADDVVHAGMGAREQLARVEAAVARRAPEGIVAEAGPLRVDRDRGEATWHGRRLPLTARERDVLHALADTHGQTVRRELLYRRVWGFAMARGDRTVDVNVKRLRGKLAEAVGPPLTIETEAGVGYRLVVGENAVTAL